MSPLRPIIALVAGLGTALVLYAAAYTHGNPHPKAGDPLLAARLIPIELLLGLVVGVLVWRVFGQRQASAPRVDAQERMVLRLALRRGGRFTLADLAGQSPLTPEQAESAVERLTAQGRLKRDGDSYRLP